MSDFSPVIVFAETRIEQITDRHCIGTPQSPEESGRIAELELIVSLCKGLQQTEDILRKQLGLVETI